ncbi:MAG: succinylglutamate desuccinylase/aspartoacylase family protein [Candidatus Bathyarchaeota archaeon]|nr:succinylglutamate desuccinylase/aspartoacylase family protein [Candidatus Bathyarchaeota archaeon]
MSFHVANITIKKGEKHQGYLNVAEASTHTVTMPYIVVNGVNSGPTLTVLSGVHGIECAPVEAVLRLARNVEPMDINGTLILVPIVNTEGFHARKPYHNQLDHQNQNKVFPGDKKASITKRVAFSVFEAFVSKSDYLVDCHSADLGEDATRGMFIYKTEDEELHRKMVKMASCFDCDFIESTSFSGNTGEAVTLYGIPCIMTEGGTPYPIRDDDVLYHYLGIKNLMRHIGMIDEEAALGSPPLDPPTKRVWAMHGGLWRRKIEAGQRVAEGELLGVVSDLHGETLQVATAPYGGVVSFLRIHYSVNEGDTLCRVTQI